jgi:hypothetical protein
MFGARLRRHIGGNGNRMAGYGIGFGSAIAGIG